MELLTVGNTQLISVKDPVAPITNPLGPAPSGDSLSVASAVMHAAGAASAGSPVLGVEDAKAEVTKNLLFVAAVVFLLWKFKGRLA